MRLFGVSMVRNEADVVEAFVRHNLALLDGLIVVDHGSIDGTSEILAKLQAEGLPLRVTPERDPAYRQSAIITRLAREALAQDAADFVFALDADEFLKLDARATLERALSEVPAGAHAVMHWLTYVPDAFEGCPGMFGPGHLWWRLKTERHDLFKVIVGRALLERPKDMVAKGNHCVRSPDEAGGASARAPAPGCRRAGALPGAQPIPVPRQDHSRVSRTPRDATPGSPTGPSLARLVCGATRRCGFARGASARDCVQLRTACKDGAISPRRSNWSRTRLRLSSSSAMASMSRPIRSNC